MVPPAAPRHDEYRALFNAALDKAHDIDRAYRDFAPAAPDALGYGLLKMSATTVWEKPDEADR